ncbi:hypothetical protein CABS01_11738 [Colletotrichum abscissum]|uniref:Uncharacterized protein n=1 Tax=Colletotrichum abscissum TaxID=1671311 RepID=A0A9Q0B4H1_9PEZI|nr:uncharacterized protein CABS01_11738 [Colletotrichum abscissum]KAI3548679.1 hypothetical protein CABS02_08209 [Colletotrichum abscissum]KAK1492841.1 hypothetical protein CABS01_11738 [Colletotrichum abscissum]
MEKPVEDGDDEEGEDKGGYKEGEDEHGHDHGDGGDDVSRKDESRKDESRKDENRKDESSGDYNDDYESDNHSDKFADATSEANGTTETLGAEEKTLLRAWRTCNELKRGDRQAHLVTDYDNDLEFSIKLCDIFYTKVLTYRSPPQCSFMGLRLTDEFLVNAEVVSSQIQTGFVDGFFRRDYIATTSVAMATPRLSRSGRPPPIPILPEYSRTVGASYTEAYVATIKGKSGIITIRELQLGATRASLDVHKTKCSRQSQDSQPKLGLVHLMRLETGGLLDHVTSVFTIGIDEDAVGDDVVVDDVVVALSPSLVPEAVEDDGDLVDDGIFSCRYQTSDVRHQLNRLKAREPPSYRKNPFPAMVSSMDHESSFWFSDC